MMPYLNKVRCEEVLGYRKVPVGFIGSHFNLRRSLGEGLYCLRIYDTDGNPTAFMSGVAWEQTTGNASKARGEYQAPLANALSRFYEVARAEVLAPEDICSQRNGNMSFLAVKCEVGVVAAGWFDAKSKKSTNGLHMLAFVLYALGVLNHHDPVLKEATMNYLPFAEGVPDFHVEAVQTELVAASMEVV
jgi:hypothetical protein